MRRLTERPGFSVPATLLSLMVFTSPLVQGGTPRLGTLILEALLAVAVAASALSARGSPEPRPVGLAEGSLWLFLFLAAVNLPLVPYYHDAERCFLLIAAYVGTFSLMLRLPEGGLGMILSAVKATGLFQALLALGQVALGGSYQPRGTFDNPNFLAGFLAAAASLLLADLLEGKRGTWAQDRRRLLLAGVTPLAVLVAAVVATRSRGGVLALATMFGALLFRRFGWRRALPAVFLGLLGLFAVPNPFRERLFSLASTDIYAYSRVRMWKNGLAMFLDHPLLGIGLGQYQFLSPRYAFPVEAHWARYLKTADNPHSEMVMLAAELGVAGLAVLVCFLLALVRGEAERRRGHAIAGPWWTLPVLAGLAVQALVDFSLHSPPVVLAAVAVLASWAAPGAGRPSFRAPRRSLRWLLAACLPLYLVLAVRPAAGFFCFLKAGGGPANLLDEKTSLAKWGAGGRQPDERYLRRAAFWDGGSAPYHSVLGSVAVKRYAASGDRRFLEEAFDELKTAIALNPNNHGYYGHLADLYLSLYRRGELGSEGLMEAAKSFRAALAIAPADVFLRERYGGIILEAGGAAEALAQFRRALELEPCFLRAALGLGRSLERLGRGREAQLQYRSLESLASECRGHKPENDYERALVDLDPALVHTRPSDQDRRKRGPESLPEKP